MKQNGFRFGKSIYYILICLNIRKQQPNLTKTTVYQFKTNRY